jgi:hypothetical protein
MAIFMQVTSVASTVSFDARARKVLAWGQAAFCAINLGFYWCWQAEKAWQMQCIITCILLQFLSLRDCLHGCADRVCPLLATVDVRGMAQFSFAAARRQSKKKSRPKGRLFKHWSS